MHVTFGVGIVEGREQVTADLSGTRDWQRPAQSLDPFQGILAVDVLHYQLKLRVDFEQLVEGDNGGMAVTAGHQEVAQYFDFTAKITACLVAELAAGADHLDGDRPVARELPGAEDFAHAAAADPFVNQIVGTVAAET